MSGGIETHAWRILDEWHRSADELAHSTAYGWVRLPTGGRMVPTYERW